MGGGAGRICVLHLGICMAVGPGVKEREREIESTNSRFI